MLYDTHCHLTLGALRDDREEVWQRAQAAGVGRALVVGIDAITSNEVLDFVAGHDGLFASVGIHPTETAKAHPGDFEQIIRLAEHPKVVAIGETGLDLYWKDSPLAVQLDSLEKHCQLALRLGLPIVLHLRDAFEEAALALRDYALAGGKAILHCFSGGPEHVEPFLSYGFTFSFSGIITYPKADNVRAAAAMVPIDRMLVETDAPWLPPVPYRGKRNEPAFVTHTAAALAKIKGVSEAVLAEQTTANALLILGGNPNARDA